MTLKHYQDFFSSKLLVLYLCCASLLVYLVIVPNQFLGDDQDFILNSTGYRHPLSIAKIITGYNPPGHDGVYRPVRGLLVLTTTTLFPDNPIYYHLFSILLHTGNTILIYFLMKLLTKDKLISFVCCLIFAVYPIHVEAITGITSTFDTVGITFLLISLYLYFKATATKPYTQSTYWFSVLCACLAILTYEPTIVLPLLILVLDKFVRGRKLFDTSLHLPYLGVMMGYLLVRGEIIQPLARQPFPPEVFWAIKLTLLKSLFVYLKLLLVPVHLSLNHFLPGSIAAHTLYSLNRKALLDQNLIDPLNIFIVVLLVFLFGIACKYRSKFPLILVSLLWIFITLVPTLNVFTVNPNLLAEKYLYLPSLGFCLLISYFFSLLWRSHRLSSYKNLLIFSLFILLSFYSYQTITRNRQWSSEINLLSTDSHRSPINPIVLYQLGLAYQKNNQIDQALATYKQVLLIVPDFSYPMLNIGYLEEIRNATESAKLWYAQAAHTEPVSPEPYHNLGILALKSNQYATASAYFTQALKIDPNFGPAQDALQFTLSRNQ